MQLSLDELRCLCRCAVAGGEGDDLLRIRGLVADPDLLALVLANRVAPHVARALLRAAPEPPLPAALAAAARETAMDSLAALAIVREVAANLDGAGIPWLLWKGPALAIAAWDDPALRQSSDLDLVVRKRDRATARALLAASGWRPRHGMTPGQQRWVLAGTGAWDLERSAAATPFLELHWRFASGRYPRGLSVPDVIGRATRMRVGTVDVPVPSPADSLVLQAMHGTKHGWSQLEEVAAFARLAGQDSRALVEARRCATLVGWGRAFALAEELALLLTAAAPPVPSASAQACLARMACGDGAWRPDHGWTLGWISTGRERVRYHLHALLAPTLEEWKWVRLADPLVWLYPLVRLVRLAFRR